MTTGTTVRAITATAIALAGLVALAGCTAPSSGASPSSSARATGGAGGGAAASAPTASGSASAKPVGTRVDIPCATLVPAAAFSAYGQTFTLAADASPAKNSPAADIATQRGRVCTWRNDAGDVTVTLAVASLPAAALTKLEDSLFEDSNSVPTYTVEGYFDLDGDVGRADAFVDPYWINVESTMFTEPGAVQPIMDAARTTLTATASASAAPSPSATP